MPTKFDRVGFFFWNSLTALGKTFTKYCQMFVEKSVEVVVFNVILIFVTATWGKSRNLTNVFQRACHHQLEYSVCVVSFTNLTTSAFQISCFHGILGGGFKHFLFSPLLGEMIQFD